MHCKLPYVPNGSQWSKSAASQGSQGRGIPAGSRPAMAKNSGGETYWGAPRRSRNLNISMIQKNKKRFIPVMSAVLGSEGLTPILKMRRPTTTATTGWIADDIERAKMA